MNPIERLLIEVAGLSSTDNPSAANLRWKLEQELQGGLDERTLRTLLDVLEDLYSRDSEELGRRESEMRRAATCLGDVAAETIEAVVLRLDDLWEESREAAKRAGEKSFDDLAARHSEEAKVYQLLSDILDPP